MTRRRSALVALGAVLVLGTANLAIVDKQGIVDRGRQVLLRLDRAASRSLLRRDGMILLYDRAAFPDRETIEGMPWRGTVVFALDGEGVGRFARLDDGTRLGPDEVRMTYRTFRMRGRPSVIRLGADSFSFQKGEARRYAGAEFGVLRVDADGDSVVVGLADENRELIQPD